MKVYALVALDLFKPSDDDDVTESMVEDVLSKAAQPIELVAWTDGNDRLRVYRFKTGD